MFSRWKLGECSRQFWNIPQFGKTPSNTINQQQYGTCFLQSLGQCLDRKCVKFSIMNPKPIKAKAFWLKGFMFGINTFYFECENAM